MRSFIFLICVFLFSVQGHAQLFTKKKVINNENFDKPQLSWGYYLGMNNYDYNFDYISDTYDIQTEKSFGFNVGLIGNFRISDFFDLKLRFVIFLLQTFFHLLYLYLIFIYFKNRT